MPAAVDAAGRINPRQSPLGQAAPVIAPAPAEWSNAGTMIGVWAIAHQFYNLGQLLTLMIESGAKIGDIYKKNFDAAAAALLGPPQQPPQAISFFYAARPFGILPDGIFSAAAPPHAWRGPQIPAAYQQAAYQQGDVIIVGGPKKVGPWSRRRRLLKEEAARPRQAACLQGIYGCRRES